MPFLAALKDAVILLNEKKLVVFCNHAAAELFQKHAEKMAGLSFLEATQSLELERFLENALSSRKTMVKEIFMARHEEKVLLCQMIPSFSSGGSKIACILQDFTKFYRLETIRRDFAANISHELKTPVAAIRSVAETLLRGAKDDASVRDKFIVSLHHEAERLSRVLQDLLDLLRFESGEFHLQKKELSLRTLCEDALQKFHDEIAQKNVAADINIEEGVPLVLADASAVEHVLRNLIDNAVKYTPEGGHIIVGARTETSGKKSMVVFVRDTGIGIPSVDLQRIFERFYRVDKARSRELGGTGLGLSIVKHLVEAHGGRVWAESQLNRGSSFYFSLPLPEI